MNSTIRLYLTTVLGGCFLITQLGCPSDPYTPGGAFLSERTLADGNVGQAYTAQVHGNKCSPQVAVTSAPLPPGLDAESGGPGADDILTISGVPTDAGTYTIKVHCVGVSGVTSIDGDVTITIKPPTLTILTGSPLPSGTQGVFYTTGLTASGGNPPDGQEDYLWELAAGSVLPAGLVLSSGGPQGGDIGGLPTVHGTFTFTIEVHYGGGMDSKVFTITIQGPPATGIQNFGGTDNPWPVVAGSSGGGAYTGLVTTGNGFYPLSVTGNPTSPVSLVVTAPTWLRTQVVNLAESDLSAVGAAGVDPVDDLNRAQELFFGQLDHAPLEYQTVSQPFTVTFDQVRGSGSASTATGNYFVDLLPLGATDYVTIRAFDGPYLPPQAAGGSNLMAVKAGSRANAKPTIFGPTLDLSLLKPPAILPFTVTGGSVGAIYTYVYRPSANFDEHVFTGGGNLQISNFPGSSGGPPFNAKVLAPSDLPAGGLQGMMVAVIDDAQNSERCAKQYFGSLNPINFVLGPPLSPVTVTDLHSPNYKRLRVTFAVQPEYDRAYEINVYVGSDPRSVIRIMTTKAYVHGASTVDITIPDVPGLAPFVPNNATPVLVQVIAKGWSDPGGLFGPRPTDGGTQRCAIRFVNVP